MDLNSFSVLISVYKNDQPDFVCVALDSMLIHQSVIPNEIVLVQDGPVSAGLQTVIREYEEKYPFLMHVIRLEENGGLGNALRIGVENAKYGIIARMDSDDICHPDRFQKQLFFLAEHPECDIVGGQMTEFIGESSNIVGRREVPLTNEEIYDYMKSRCALNHVTVMFRKKAVLKAGNYQDWFWNEDYYLWVRMMMAKCQFANIPDVIVNVRSGADQYARRGGRKYFKSEAAIQKLMLDHKLISWPRYCFNVIVRWCIQVAMPNWLRGFVFQKLFRK